MSDRDANDQGALLKEFRRALRNCREIYATSAQDVLRFEPNAVGQAADQFIRDMDQWHRRLLVDVFVAMCGADRQFSSGEYLLATELARHVGECGDDRKKIDRWLSSRWQSLQARPWDWSTVRPFAQWPLLRARGAELHGVVMRVANIVSKIDGKLHPDTVEQLRMIESGLWENLGRQGPIDRTNDKAPKPDAPSQKDAPSTSDRHQHAGDDRPTAPADSQPRPTPEGLAGVLGELNGLIGLQAVKHDIHELVAFLKVQRQREQQLNIPPTKVSLHMVFNGNPGTGKTTVARLVGRVFGDMGILSKGHLIETDRSGLVAEYVGQTATKSHKQIDEALDGVLFIDEAYSLASGRGQDSYGNEALQVLLKRAEDDRDRLVVVMAGYTGPMEKMLGTNPGLKSRFSRRLEFPDFSGTELCRIFQLFCDKNQYRLAPLTRFKLLLGFQYVAGHHDESFGNGRLARNVFERAIRKMAMRVAPLAPVSRELLTTLEPNDIVIKGVPPETYDELTSESHKLSAPCPNCEKTVHLPPSMLGQPQDCPECNTSVCVDWATPRAPEPTG